MKWNKDDASSARRARIREALQDLSSVLEEIADAAAAKSCERCPYMNVQRECTAAFSCLNQVLRSRGGPPLCSGQHKINYELPRVE